MIPDVWYRWEAVIYDDAPSYVALRRAYVHKETPAGVWLYYDQPVNFIGQSDLRTSRVQGAWWQSVELIHGLPFTSNAGRYKPTREQAWTSFKKRTAHRISHAERALRNARIARTLSQQPMPSEGSPLRKLESF